MIRKEYDTYVLTDLALVPEDKEAEMILRDLTPSDRRYKYRSFFRHRHGVERRVEIPGQALGPIGQGPAPGKTLVR
jgi:hypothetical protein